MTKQMKNNEQMHDHELQQFDNWLQNTAVQVRPGMVDRVRARLDETADVDGIIDELLQPDYSLRDPSMLQKVRRRIEDASNKDNRLAWTKWLPPLAAAATLTLAFISFQKQVPSAPELDMPSLATVESVDSDPELTRIMILAASLQSSTDVAKLDSAEDLAFLFE